jgi:polyhydroxybutyrate depolymerase
VDDVAYLAAVIDDVQRRFNVDARRIFLVGHSNGGFMAHRFACERPELVRGIVSIAGAGPLDRSACKNPSSSLRVLEIHGDADPIVTYDGGHLFKNPSLPEHASARRTVADWAAALGCRSTQVAGPALDVEPHLAGAETRTESYPGCKSGSVELWTVRGGSHYVGFRSPAPAAIWDFLNR